MAQDRTIKGPGTPQRAPSYGGGVTSGGERRIVSENRGSRRISNEELRQREAPVEQRLEQIRQPREQINQGAITEAIGSSVGGGYIVQQRNPFTGETSRPFTVTQTETGNYRADSPFAMGIQYDQSIASTQKGTLYINEQGTRTVETRSGRRSEILLTNRIVGIPTEKGSSTIITLRREQPFAQAYGPYLNQPTSSFAYQDIRQPNFRPSARQRITAAVNLPGDVLSTIRSPFVGGGRQFLRDPIAQQSLGVGQRARRQYLNEEPTSFWQNVGERIRQEPRSRLGSGTPYILVSEAYRQFSADAPILGGLDLPSERAREGFQRGRTAFEEEYFRISGRYPSEATSREAVRRIASREAGKELLITSVGVGTEVVGRVGVSALTRGSRLVFRQGLIRIGAGTGVAGAIEGGATSVIEQAPTGRISAIRTGVDILSGAASAGTISATQFGLDTGGFVRRAGRGVSQRIGRVFSRTVNVLDYTEPISDAGATLAQRRLRNIGVRGITVSEPTARQVRFRDPIMQFSFGTRMVDARSSINARSFFGIPTRTTTATRPFTTPVGISPRTSISPRSSITTTTRVSPRVTPSIFTTPVTSRPQIPVMPRPRTTTRISVLTPDLPPIFPPLFRMGGGGRGRISGASSLERRSFTASVSGRVFGLGGGRGSLQALTGLGARR